jgi:hypothetical protein
MPPLAQITALLTEILDGLASGAITMDFERVPLAGVAGIWARDQKGRRPVFIP